MYLKISSLFKWLFKPIDVSKQRDDKELTLTGSTNGNMVQEPFKNASRTITAQIEPLARGRRMKILSSSFSFRERIIAYLHRPYIRRANKIRNSNWPETKETDQ